MQMPLTAVVLVMEFTHMDHSYLAPTLLCAAGQIAVIHVGEFHHQHHRRQRHLHGGGEKSGCSHQAVRGRGVFDLPGTG
jgi:H+/Cl- antiporter ClcA